MQTPQQHDKLKSSDKNIYTHKIISSIKKFESFFSKGETGEIHDIPFQHIKQNIAFPDLFL